LTRDLIEDTFLPPLDNPFLKLLSDAAVLPELPPGRPALTTDAFVVDPPVFPGGDLGHLSVCGTANDLTMAGARPMWLTWALILEEGATGELVATCTAGAARAAREAGVTIVAGDTKVVPRGKGDRIYAVTAGLGVVPPERRVEDSEIEPDDAVLVSGPIGDHGATIMAARHELGSDTLCSDSAAVTPLVEALFAAGITVHSMHDPTRGGVLAVCTEVSERSGLRVVLNEEKLPVRPEVHAVTELLGLDPLSLACEGRFLAWVPRDQMRKALDVLATFSNGREAAEIGHMERRQTAGAPVILNTRVGGRRPLDLLSGTDLPRIC